MKSTIKKTCLHCQNEFETTNSRKRYCSDTCKTYASQVRTGKREAPIFLPSEEEPLTEERKKELLEEAGRLNQEFLQVQSRREACLEFFDNMQFKKTYNEELRIEDLEEILSSSKIKESVRKEVNEELKLLKREVEEAKIYNSQLREKSKEIEQEFEGFFMRLFRALERRNQFIQTHIFNKGELPGNAIAQYRDVQTRYPFEEMDHRLFAPMGNPVQPFFALITGAKGTGKSILGTLICTELIEWFESKILFVVDDQNQGSILEYFADKKVSTDLLSIKFADTLGDIENALSKGEYEFMFIDSNHHFKLHESNFRKLRKMYPFLSIFLIARHKTNSIAELSSIEFDVRNNNNPGHGVIRVGWADIYVNGAMAEDQDCGIFVHNVSQGFQIGL